MWGLRGCVLVLLLAAVGAQNATNVTVTQHCHDDFFCDAVGSNGMMIMTPPNGSVYPVRTDTTDDFISFFVLSSMGTPTLELGAAPYIEVGTDACDLPTPRPQALFDLFEDFSGDTCGVTASAGGTEFLQKTAGLTPILVRLAFRTEETSLITSQTACFSTPSGPKRCIILRPIRRPSSVKIASYVVDGNQIALPINQDPVDARAMVATVGNTLDGDSVARHLTFEVLAEMDNPLDRVMIRNEESTAELPKQKWMSATQYNATVSPPFKREVQYKSTKQAAGQTFKLVFEAVTQLGPQHHMFTQDGSAWCRCQPSFGAGGCSPSLCTAHELKSSSAEYTVFVRPVTVSFNFDVVPGLQLFNQGTNDQDSGLTSFQGPGTMAMAHVNCKMPPVAISASMSFILNQEIAIESPLTLEFVDDTPPAGFKSLGEMGMTISETQYY